MIDLPTARSDTARRLWAEHLRCRMDALRLNDAGGISDVFEGLAAFCEQHPYMAGHTLSLLMARSFCAAGNRDAAVRVLQNDQVHCRYAEPWLDALSAEYPFPDLYPLFSTRVLRPFRLATAGSRAVWVLDLRKIALTDADRHEMILQQTLRVLVENVSNVWKKAEGQGTLVVKGLVRLCSLVRPELPQMTGYLQDILCRCADRNGWSAVPSVLLFDL